MCSRFQFKVSCSHGRHYGKTHNATKLLSSWWPGNRVGEVAEQKEQGIRHRTQIDSALNSLKNTWKCSIPKPIHQKLLTAIPKDRDLEPKQRWEAEFGPLGYMNFTTAIEGILEYVYMLTQVFGLKFFDIVYKLFTGTLQAFPQFCKMTSMLL